MGVLSGAVGGHVGSLLGEKLGALGGRRGKDAGRDIGRIAGSMAGGALPFFKKGGKVNKTGLAVVHKGEYVLPAGVKPTKAQKAKVAKKKAKK
jgi:hypothetical protein